MSSDASDALADHCFLQIGGVEPAPLAMEPQVPQQQPSPIFFIYTRCKANIKPPPSQEKGRTQTTPHCTQHTHTHFKDTSSRSFTLHPKWASSVTPLKDRSSSPARRAKCCWDGPTSRVPRIVPGRQPPGRRTRISAGLRGDGKLVLSGTVRIPSTTDFRG